MMRILWACRQNYDFSISGSLIYQRKYLIEQCEFFSSSFKNIYLVTESLIMIYGNFLGICNFPVSFYWLLCPTMTHSNCHRISPSSFSHGWSLCSTHHVNLSSVDPFPQLLYLSIHPHIVLLARQLKHSGKNRWWLKYLSLCHSYRSQGWVPGSWLHPGLALTMVESCGLNQQLGGLRVL